MRSKTNIKLVLTMLPLLWAAAVSAQSVKSLVRKGNKLYDQKKYPEAEVMYRKAQAKNPKYEKSTFNLGDALYQQKNFKGAENFFGHLAEKTKTPEYKANAWYNLGNTYLSQKQYEKSISAFIQSLKNDPTSMDAKYNLTNARKMLKKQKQQQKKNKQNKKKNKKQNQKNKQNQNKKNQNKKNQNKKNQQKQNQQNKKQQQKQQKNQSQKKKQQISPQEAQRILNALKNNEKNTLKKLEKQKAKAIKAKANVINW
jgi:tetratricopeptide (TPR) repeat protein